VIVYARVSTTRQADHDLSIPTSLPMPSLLRRTGFEIVTRYIDPAPRPATTTVLNSSACLRTSRLGSPVRPSSGSQPVAVFPRLLRLAFYCRELVKYGVRVISATQEMTDDANGALMRNVLSAFDEYTSLETAKHVTRSMLENAAEATGMGQSHPSAIAP